MKPGQEFPKAVRLLSRGDFRRVYERGCWIGDDLLRLAGQLNDLPHPRMGLAVSRQMGGAVQRNRWKRLIREAFRRARPELPPGLDFIVIPRRPGEPKLEPIAKSLTNLSWRLAKRLKREASLGRRNKLQDRQQESEP
jgi:ribonuclease P protein component